MLELIAAAVGGIGLTVGLMLLFGAESEEVMEEQEMTLFEDMYCPSCGAQAVQMGIPKCQAHVPVRTFGCLDPGCEVGIYIVGGKSKTPRGAVQLLHEIHHAAEVHIQMATPEAIAIERNRAKRN